MEFILGVIGTLILGAIIGYGGRAILPGAQHIGLSKTVLIGVVAAFVGGLLFSWFWFPITWLISAVIAAVVLAVSIKQGWVKPEGTTAV